MNPIEGLKPVMIQLHDGEWLNVRDCYFGELIEEDIKKKYNENL